MTTARRGRRTRVTPLHATMEGTLPRRRARRVEEYNAAELANHLSRAHDDGVSSPAPEAGSEQLIAFPKACTAAAAEEEDEGDEEV